MSWFIFYNITNAIALFDNLHVTIIGILWTFGIVMLICMKNIYLYILYLYKICINKF